MPLLVSLLLAEAGKEAGAEKVEGQEKVKVQTIKAQPLLDSDYADMEAQLKALFDELLFQPIVALLAPHNQQVRAAAKELLNASTDVLVAALKAGRVQYTDGVFSGDFNAGISKSLLKIGAKFDKRSKVYKLAPNKVPPDVLAMATKYDAAAKGLHDELLKRLSEIEAGLSKAVDARPVDAAVTISKIKKGFEDTAGEAISRKDLSEDSSARLSKEYSENMKLWVRDFSKDMILEMREDVEENAAVGYRFDHLVERLQGRYSVTRSKAKFLARQETALFTAKHRQLRFEEVGVTRYVWRTAHDSRVRDRHKELNGREFFYKEPPIVDTATGRRGNPGQDYNCRCVDIPILAREVANALS